MSKPYHLFPRQEVFVQILKEPLAYYKKNYSSLLLFLRQNTPLAEPLYYQLVKRGGVTFIFFSQTPFTEKLNASSISTLACSLYAQQAQSYVLFLGKEFIELTQFEHKKLIASMLLPMNMPLKESIQKYCKEDIPLRIIHEAPLIDSLPYPTVAFSTIPAHKITFRQSLPNLGLKVPHLILGFAMLLAGYIKVELWQKDLEGQKVELDNKMKRVNQYQQILQTKQNQEQERKQSTTLIVSDLYQFLHHLYQSMESPIQIHKIYLKENHFIIEATLENPFILMEQLSHSSHFKSVSIEYVQIKSQQEYFRIEGNYHVD